MCGIAGALDLNARTSQVELKQWAASMASALTHRGPDDHGAWVDERSGVALGHRRLAILDVSPTGQQPMRSASGRYVVVYNGEIYNYLDLRAELEVAGAAPAYRGRSDTEVLLAAIEVWGLIATLPRLNGMFAIALWDTHARVLHLVRDRAGQKPLYYGTFRGTFLFGSELHALRAHPAFTGRVDRDALALFVRHNYVPNPYSIYQGVRQLPPASRVEVRASGACEPIRWWFPSPEPAEDSLDDAAERLEQLLLDAVRLQMISDVPLGAMLSGGTDSSLLVAMMQRTGTRPVKTFTIGFQEEAFDEASHAKRVAAYLGTEHCELYVTSERALEVVPKLPEIYGEPFADSSQIPTWLVCELARREVTVCIAGDGGDEILGGYTRYLRTMLKWNALRWIPRLARRATGRLLDLGAALPGPTQRLLSAERLRGLPGLLRSGGPDVFYRASVSHTLAPTALVPGAVEPPTTFTEEHPLVHGPLAERMMRQDFVSYLPDDILVKVDRASMSVGLEARAPLLDFRVVEYAMSLPVDWKIRQGTGKWLLKRVLDRYVPTELVDRPKRGFGIPLEAWLRGPLRDWAEDLLAQERVEREGTFQSSAVREHWTRFLRGQQGLGSLLWNLLMFQAWLATVPGQVGPPST